MDPNGRITIIVGTVICWAMYLLGMATHENIILFTAAVMAVPTLFVAFLFDHVAET